MRVMRNRDWLMSAVIAATVVLAAGPALAGSVAMPLKVASWTTSGSVVYVRVANQTLTPQIGTVVVQANVSGVWVTASAPVLVLGTSTVVPVAFPSSPTQLICGVSSDGLDPI